MVPSRLSDALHVGSSGSRHPSTRRAARRARQRIRSPRGSIAWSVIAWLRMAGGEGGPIEDTSAVSSVGT